MGRSTTSHRHYAEPKHHHNHHIHIPHPHLPSFAHPKSSSETYVEPPPKRSTSIKHNSSSLKHSSSSASRANGLNRQNSQHTRYVTMLLAQDTIPRFHTILAAAFTWILLAGFLVFPGTFTSIQRIEADGETEKKVLAAVKNVKLIYIGAVCCGVGGGGMTWLVCLLLLLSKSHLRDLTFLPRYSKAIALCHE